MGKRPELHILIIAALATFCGCHSACFQTAEIRNGPDATIGVTAVRAADDTGVSDYSIFIKGELGRSARRDRFGYSLGLTFISPFRSMGHDLIGGGEPETGSFPNEWAGVMPEFKLQMPRRLPVDVAVDARLNTIYPERIGALASRKIGDRLTGYACYFLVSDIGQLAIGGGELRLTETVSLMAEYSTWLSDHDYPGDYRGGRRKQPYAFGIALAYHPPRRPEPYDKRLYAKNHKGDTSLNSTKE
jgi:hypothetical protein